jgi:hypothetical protein
MPRARLVCGLLLLGVASPALATRCDPTGGDAVAVVAARAAVEASCACDQPGQTHGQYVRCARAAIETSGIRRECRGTVRRCYARSTCGKPGYVTCCRTSAAGTPRCTVRRDPSSCVAPSGGSACVGGVPSCCDACGAPACASSTSSTTVVVATTTTLATLPPLPDNGCNGGSGAPTCDGTCDAGFDCRLYARFEGPACGCFPTGTPSCDATLYPQCSDGACPGGTACGGFIAYDPGTATFLTGCGCVDPARTCSSDASGMCASVGYCAPPLVCTYTPIAPHANCPCCGCGVAF